MNPAYVPALGALAILAFDLVSRSGPDESWTPRSSALAGIRFGAIALLSLVAVVVALRSPDAGVDAFAAFGIAFVVGASLLVLGLSLTHFGMARSRPAEPIALLLFSLSGMAAAIVTEHLLVLMVAIELGWLPTIALISIDSRRLSSSESSLKAFFAHVFASVVFAHGVAFLFGATGGLEMRVLGEAVPDRALLFDVGATLVVLGLVARAVIAPFHPWSPDVHEGAPSFVAAYLATAAQATTFLVLLRMAHALAPEGAQTVNDVAQRLPTLLGLLGCLGLLWGHAMALVQVGLRRLLGWLGVGQVGFFTLALVDGTGEGGSALLLALFASGVSIVGALAILSSLSHHERACEHVGDLSGMMHGSPIRATLLALFLLSIAGFPGTVGFIARVEILAALERGGHRGLMIAGLAATVLALAAVGRPLLAILRPMERHPRASRALSNEQLVLALCAGAVLYFGVAPVVSVEGVSGFFDWLERALAALRT
jgi:NADH-quinone oxidoreductase subunit N